MVYFRRAFLANKSLETKRLVWDLFERNAAAFGIRSAPALEPWAAHTGGVPTVRSGGEHKTGSFGWWKRSHRPNIRRRSRRYQAKKRTLTSMGGGRSRS